MSMIRSVSLLANTETAPLEPAGTMTAFAVMLVVEVLSVETSGSPLPQATLTNTRAEHAARP